MISQRKGLFNTSGAGQGFWRFRLGKRKAFARAKRATARRAIPTLTLLEQRHLLSFTPTWIGQNGSDFVGTVARSPNDYQDVVIHLSDLKTTVSEIYVQRYGGGAWDYKPSSSTSAFFQASGDPKQGDLYLEPYFNDPTNYWYELTRVFYVDGSKEDYTTLHSTTSVDANLRVHGRELSADWLGQDGNDWTGNGPSVGPNGIQDFHLKVSNISTGGTVSSLVLTANPGPSAQSWQIGTNPQGYSNAELLNRVTSGGTDTADYFGNPSSSLSNGAPLTLQLTYSDQNRGGKTDTVPISAGLTVGNIGPTLAMPLTSVTNFAAATAHSTAQDAGYPGFSHIVLDTPLPNPETTATVQAAVLSDQAGTTWVYGSTTPYTGASPLSMSYDPNSGTFSYPPVRDESSATLTLRLLFTDGAQAVAQVAGATSDPRRRDQPVGTSSENVGTAALLMDAVNRQIANIHLAAGTYLMSAPLNLNYPVKITADPGASVVFSPSPSNPSWTNASGAIGVWASHVSLDGFAISFQGDSASWAYTGSTTRAVIQSAGNGNGGKVDLSFTNLNIQAPAAHTAGEEAVHLMNFDSSDSGQIVGNTLKGGTISLWNGPWQICNNDYQGAPANSISCSVFFIRNEHDVLIQGNHIHSVTPAGATYRFLLFGACDTGRGFNDVIQNNTVDGGIGRPATDNSNNPEIILTEQCQPRFEGTPSSVSPDGYVLQVPYMRGPTAMTGDVVAILSGSQAGQWRLIAQALSPTEYLLDSPLPTTGDYTIAIGRGWVHDTYQDNTIDLRGTNPGNVALDLTGDHFGTRVLNNTFLGSNAISISATPTEGAFSGTNPPDWGWTHLPIFGVAIDGNTFQDAGLSLNVNHSRYVKSNRGRVYFTGSFTNNAITWSTGPQPAAIVGIPAQNGEPAYTSQNFPWLDDGELVLNLQGNWGVRSDGVVAATIQVIAGTIWDSSASQGAMENKSLPLPKSPPNGLTTAQTISLPGSTTPAPVNLAPYYNQVGLTSDNATGPGNLDGGGYSYSANALGGGIINWQGVPFVLGPAGQNDVVQAAGQTIPLSSGNYTALFLIGTAVQGGKTGTFTMHYTDGSTSVVNQEFSDWANDSSNPGEYVVRTMSYRNYSQNNGLQTLTMYAYGYSLPITPGKTLQSVTLPANADINILSMDLAGP